MRNEIHRIFGHRRTLDLKPTLPAVRLKANVRTNPYFASGNPFDCRCFSVGESFCRGPDLTGCGRLRRPLRRHGHLSWGQVARLRSSPVP